MKNIDKAASILILKGYNEKIASQLPKLFIADYFEKQQEIISEALDFFIDEVQSKKILPNEDNNVNFAGILKMEEKDFHDYDVECSGLFYEFRIHIIQNFLRRIHLLPLEKILESGGALDGPGGYFKPIVEPSQNYHYLCEIINPYSDEYIDVPRIAYIMLNDLYNLLKSKGINKEAISLVWSKGIYINYDAIMALGNQNYISAKNKNIALINKK